MVLPLRLCTASLRLTSLAADQILGEAVQTGTLIMPTQLLDQHTASWELPRETLRSPPPGRPAALLPRLHRTLAGLRGGDEQDGGGSHRADRPLHQARVHRHRDHPAQLENLFLYID